MPKIIHLKDNKAGTDCGNTIVCQFNVHQHRFATDEFVFSALCANVCQLSESRIRAS